MRILLLNYEYPPLGGGAGFAMAELARRLAERGAAVDIVTSRADMGDGITTEPERVRGFPPGCTGELTLYRVRSRRKGVHEAGMGAASGYLRAALPVVRRLTRRYRYDVIHVFFSLPTGGLLPFVDLQGVPVVVSLRGSDVPGYDVADRKMQLTHRMLRPLTRWIWRRSDRVVALSEGLGQLALRTDPGLRFTVIRNGVDVDLFRPPKLPRAARTVAVRCLAVARLIERKGLDDLLRALALLPRGRFHLEIVGSGRDEASLHRLAAQLGLDREVHFAGAVPHDTVAAYYQRADLFTLVPENEAFGNVFAEALASGLPIVASNVGGIPEFVEHGTNGLLVPPHDPAALANAIRRLAEDAVLRTVMGAGNRAKAEATLSWDHVTDRYLEVYHELMAPQLPERLLAHSGAD